jgi:hypothetical protein
VSLLSCPSAWKACIRRDIPWYQPFSGTSYRKRLSRPTQLPDTHNFRHGTFEATTKHWTSFVINLECLTKTLGSVTNKNGYIYASNVTNNGCLRLLNLYTHLNASTTCWNSSTRHLQTILSVLWSHCSNRCSKWKFRSPGTVLRTKIGHNVINQDTKKNCRAREMGGGRKERKNETLEFPSRKFACFEKKRLLTIILNVT